VQVGDFDSELLHPRVDSISAFFIELSRKIILIASVIFMLATNQCNHLISSTPTSLLIEFQFKMYWCRDVPPCTNPLSITIPPCLNLKKLPYEPHYTTLKWSQALPIANVFWSLWMVSDKLVGLWTVLNTLSNLLSLIFTTHRPQNRCLLINCL